MREDGYMLPESKQVKKILVEGPDEIIDLDKEMNENFAKERKEMLAEKKRLQALAGKGG